MSSEPFSFVVGGGDLGERIRAFDWSATALGPLSAWPQSLKTAVRIMLTSRQPIWIGWGEDLIYLYNDPYKSIIGGKHPWALGRPTKEVWREIWPDIGPLLAKAMGGDEGTYVEAQLLIMERSGYPEETYYTFSYSPIPDDQGNPGGIICANTDDTQRVIGERQLALLRELAASGGESRTLQQVCTNTVQALATNQRDLPFTALYLADPGGKSFTLIGWTPLGSRHSSFPKTIAVNEVAPWPVAEVAANQAPRAVDLKAHVDENVPCGDWDQSPQTAALIPIAARGETGRQGVLIVGLNPFRLFDDAYRSFLTLAASEIAASLANAQAYEDERRRAEALAEIDRAKTLFFSNVSHEFRTPLTLMLGPLEEVLAKPADDVLPNHRALIEVAYRNSLRLLKLVNSLLDFSRIEAGRAQATYEATDLATFTSELASNFRSACERAGLHLTIDCPPLAEPAYVDRDMWEKVTLNLLSNAFKFTFEGEIGVRLRQTSGQAEMSISDSGVGIPEHELPRVFERFHRIEGQKSRTFEGSGIGLALVQELVNLHKGTISVDSAIGKGTTFTVAIPLGRSHLPRERIRDDRILASTAARAEAYVEEALRWLPGSDTPLPSSPRIITATSQPPAESGRVLLADDNADMRAYISRLLTSQFQVQAVEDGEAAMQAIRGGKPDLVLADVMMPRLDGLGLVRAIRSSSALADLPVILLSARADEEARLEGLNAGADDYLTKPFNAHELLARVGANLRLARMRQEVTRDLQYRKAQFETLFNQAPLGIYLVDSELRVREVNPTALPAFGDIPVVGRGLDEIMHTLWPDKYADKIVQIFRHTLQTGESFTTPHSAELRADRGAVEHCEWRVDRTTLPDGSYGVVCYFRDIAAQIDAENTRQLLVRELNHRVKNTLANVQAIAQQTTRSTRDPDEFARRFSGRIQSLARVHALLTDATWHGTDLRELIRDQLLHGSIDETRLTAWGPTVHLEPQMSVHLAVMLHELGTNSIKYGALSAAKGWVAVNWTVLGDMLNLQWVERGGPPVSAPSRRGFGTTLIEQSAKSEGGKAEPLVEPEGLTWKISMRLPPDTRRQAEMGGSKMVKPSDAQLQGVVVAKPETPFADRRFLIVEDESLIALDLVDKLERLGAADARLASTEEDSLSLLEQQSFDCALLDANLHGRPVENIAAALTRRKIPFVFVTGYGRAGLPAAFRQAPVLAKPINDDELVEAVIGLVSTARNVVSLRS